MTLCACGGGSATIGGGARGIRIVAAENVWGSIVMELAGSKAQVQSIITNPAADPHSYDPTAADARALASAQLVIVNGIGYDPWAPRLLAANSAGGRTVLTVGDLLGLKQGDNPHRWYDPRDVQAVASAIAADLKQLAPHDASYFARQLVLFDGRRLAGYHRMVASIRSRYTGVPVGASESIFAALSPALSLDLVTPHSFMKAVSEGTEASAGDTSTTQRQISDRQIKIWIYNPQNATPQIQQLNSLAHRRGIPIASVSETLTPAGASFEDWQVAQLEGIARALHDATGR